MDMVAIYSFIIFLSTVIGALTGLGGGIIIKPLLDSLNFHDASAVGFYSSIAVFSMCISSNLKQFSQSTLFNKRIVFIVSLGSLLGGFLGEKIFANISAFFTNIKSIQSIILFIILIVVFCFNYREINYKKKIESIFGILFSGFFLGVISTFLGIGGGPLNIILFSKGFSLSLKESINYSLITIFFSQLAKLSYITFMKDYQNYDLTPIYFIPIVALIGGYLGKCLGNALNTSQIKRAYQCLLVFLMFICVFNFLSPIKNYF